MGALHVQDLNAAMHTQTHIQAIRLVEFLIYKGPIGIASLYLSLLESAEEPNSPPSHYQLLSKVKEAGIYLL